MEELSLLESTVQGSLGFARDSLRSQSSSKTVPSLSWKDSPSIQHLLDAISSIIAEEYIAIAKQNPAVFSGKEIALGASRPRNDTQANGVRNDKL